MLEKSVARAVDTADRKINLVMSAISSIEERMESLTNTKADLGVVALKSELDSSITDSRVFMDERLQVSTVHANGSVRIDAWVYASEMVTTEWFCPGCRNFMLRFRMVFQKSWTSRSLVHQRRRSDNV